MSINEVSIHYYRLDQITDGQLKLLNFMIKDSYPNQKNKFLDDWTRSKPRKQLIGVMWSDPEKMHFFLCRNITEARELIDFQKNSLFINFKWHLFSGKQSELISGKTETIN